MGLAWVVINNIKGMPGFILDGPKVVIDIKWISDFVLDGPSLSGD